MGMGLLLAAVDVGQYVSAVKAIPVVLLLLGWARLLTWIDKDSEEVQLPRIPLNIAYIAGGIVAFFLFFFIPNFWISLPVLLLLLAAIPASYLHLRKKKAGLDDLKEKFKEFKESLKKKKGKDDAVEDTGKITLTNRKGAYITAPDETDEEYPAYEAVQGLLLGPITKNAERLDMAPAKECFAIRYYVDGFPFDDIPMDPLNGAAAITYLKELAGMDVAEKRKPQLGTIKILLGQERHDLEVRVAGSKVGETLRILVDPKRRHDRHLNDLGMLPEQKTAIEASIKDNRGVVLVGSLRAGGMTSMLYGVIRAHDAFLNHIQTIEHASEGALEGITQNKLPPTAIAADEVKLVSWVSSQEPDVIMIDQIDDPTTAVELIRFAETGKRVYVGVRGGNTFDMINSWRKLVGDDTQAMKSLQLVLNGRIVRKLCDACKVAYTPDPNTLRKLNMDPEKVGKLYQARTEPMKDAKGKDLSCQFCHDLHFKGRIGIFEAFVIDDDVRRLVIEGGSSNQLKTAFRKQHGKYLQEHGLILVEKGLTSIDEVVRAMKVGETAAKAPAAPASK